MTLKNRFITGILLGLTVVTTGVSIEAKAEARGFDDFHHEKLEAIKYAKFKKHKEHKKHEFKKDHHKKYKKFRHSRRRRRFKRVFGHKKFFSGHRF